MGSFADARDHLADNAVEKSDSKRILPRPAEGKLGDSNPFIFALAANESGPSSAPTGAASEAGSEKRKTSSANQSPTVPYDPFSFNPALFAEEEKPATVESLTQAEHPPAPEMNPEAGDNVGASPIQGDSPASSEGNLDSPVAAPSPSEGEPVEDEVFNVKRTLTVAEILQSLRHRPSPRQNLERVAVLANHDLMKRASEGEFTSAPDVTRRSVESPPSVPSLKHPAAPTPPRTSDTVRLSAKSGSIGVSFEAPPAEKKPEFERPKPFSSANPSVAKEIDRGFDAPRPRSIKPNVAATTSENRLAMRLEDPRFSSACDQGASTIVSDSARVMPAWIDFLHSGEDWTGTRELVGMATILAEGHGPVLLVDGRGGRYGISHTLGRNSSFGLAEVLASSAELSEAIVPTFWPEVSVLPYCGRYNPTEPTLNLHRLGRIIAACRNLYRFCLCDIGAISAPLSRQMALQGQGAYLFVRLNHSLVEQTASDVNEFRDQGGVILGAFVA